MSVRATASVSRVVFEELDVAEGVRIASGGLGQCSTQQRTNDAPSADRVSVCIGHLRAAYKFQHRLSKGNARAWFVSSVSSPTIDWMTL